MGFSGQVAVVTGAGSGIGRATALALSQAGATVCLVGRNTAKLQEVAAASDKKTVRCYPVDLAKDEDVRHFANVLRREMRKVHILVHSAGAIALSPVRSAAEEDFDRLYRTNLRAPFLLTRLLSPMILSNHGQVVFVNSNAALRPGKEASQYAATKAGLRAFADSLREEVNGSDVRVLSIFVGRTATPMQEAVHEHESKPYDPSKLMQPDDVAAMIISALALPRTTEVTDIILRPMKPS